MKATTSLSLAASPPFEGPWVPIGWQEKWTPRAETRPHIQNQSDYIEVEVLTHDGKRFLSPLNRDVTGVRARVLVKDMPVQTSVTVYLEPPEV